MTKQATRALHARINRLFASDTRIECITITPDCLRSQSIGDEIDALPAILPVPNLGNAPPSVFVRFELEDRLYLG